MKTHILITALVLITLGGVSCSGRGDILSQKEMTELLIDVRISESIMQQYNATTHHADSIKKQSVLLYRAVFDKHNATYSQYQKSIDWYMERPKVFKKISEEVDAKLMQLRDSSGYEII